MLAVVQAIAAEVAATSHMSLQRAILKSYGRGPAIVSLVSIVVICLMTLGADVQAGAEALGLLTGAPFYYFVVPFAAIVAWMLATSSYLRIERILASLTLIFLCYVASAVLAHPDWHEVFLHIVVPRFELSPPFIAGAIALLGTTLTGYVYFWESIEVAERRPALSQFKAVTSDAIIGMLVAGSSFLFILIATAATAGKHQVTVQSASDAAAALKPLAGTWDQILFGIGLLASAAIAVPVMAATNGYMIAHTFGMRGSLTLRPREAPVFYGTVFASLAIAALVGLLRIPTLALLYWVSVAAGLVTPITLALTVMVARNRAIMNGRPISAALAGAGWIVTSIVAVASIAFSLSAAPWFRTY